MPYNGALFRGTQLLIILQLLLPPLRFSKERMSSLESLFDVQTFLVVSLKIVTFLSSNEKKYQINCDFMYI